jgi:phenylalanyl-tRNA synthetase beta chain
LGVVAWGFETSLWNAQPAHAVVLELKQALAEVFTAFGVVNHQLTKLQDRGKSASFLHRGQNAIIEKEGARMGFLGTLHPVLLADAKIRVPVAILEIELEPLFKGQPRVKNFSDFSRFPKIQRDLALLTPLTLSVTDIMKEARKAAGPALQSIEVFDQYIGEKLP